jgi:mono/diheme cytochrome c family protein
MEMPARGALGGVPDPCHGAVVAGVVVLLVAALLAGGVRAEPAASGGAAVFQTHCAGCHGDSGRADTPGARALKVRPLAGDPALARMQVAAVVTVITSNAKHRCLGALTGVDDAALGLAAGFVRHVAKGR